MVKTIFYSLAALFRKILFLQRQNKIHIFKISLQVMLAFRVMHISILPSFLLQDPNKPSAHIEAANETAIDYQANEGKSIFLVNLVFHWFSVIRNFKYY